MKFEYQMVMREKSEYLRKKFIDSFINKSHELYALIDGVSADEEVTNFEGYMESYLWSCLKSEYKVKTDFYSMMNYLGKMEKEKVYAMWDVRPKKVIYPFKVNLNPDFGSALYSSTTSLSEQSQAFKIPSFLKALS